MAKRMKSIGPRPIVHPVVRTVPSRIARPPVHTIPPVRHFPIRPLPHPLPPTPFLPIASKTSHRDPGKKPPETASGGGGGGAMSGGSPASTAAPQDQDTDDQDQDQDTSSDDQDQDQESYDGTDSDTSYEDTGDDPYDNSVGFGGATGLGSMAGDDSGFLGFCFGVEPSIKSQMVVTKPPPKPRFTAKEIAIAGGALAIASAGLYAMFGGTKRIR